MPLFWITQITQITCKGKQSKWIHSGNEILPLIINAPRAPRVTRDLLLETILQLLLLPLEKLLLFIAKGTKKWHAVRKSLIPVWTAPAPQTRVDRVQIVKWIWGEAVGNCSTDTLVKVQYKPQIAVGCVSLPYSPIWKDSLDNLFQRPCSLSIFQRENCYLCIFITWDILCLYFVN